MADPLPLPPHWDPDRVAEVWRVDYAARFEEAERWRDQHGLLAAAADRFRVLYFPIEKRQTATETNDPRGELNSYECDVAKKPL